MDEQLHSASKQMVVKSNDFIQQKRYDLTIAQQKILCYIISKIKPDETDFKKEIISINEFCTLCGQNTPDYTFVREVLDSLYKNNFWYDDTEAKSMKNYTWIDGDMEINYGEGTVSIKLSEALKPYLLNLKGKFTQYQLINVLSLRSKYSIRLYELLKSYQNLDNSLIIKVEKLRSLLMCDDTYKEFKYFNRYVLSNSIEDINKHTDITVFQYPQKSGKKTTAIMFVIVKK